MSQPSYHSAKVYRRHSALYSLMYDADFIMLLTNLSCMTVLHQ